MKFAQLAAALVLSSVCGAALAQTQPLAPDQDHTINGVQVACTGITGDSRLNPRWRDYPLKLEFVGSHGQYLGDEKLTVNNGGKTISFACEGPWVLLNLPPGTYHIATDVADAGHKDVTASVGERRHTDVIVRFPDAGGGVTGPNPGTPG